MGEKNYSGAVERTKSRCVSGYCLYLLRTIVLEIGVAGALRDRTVMTRPRVIMVVCPWSVPGHQARCLNVK
jgi:hypothetical protein